jgi:thiol-disulfide isomerase/thioredoxin
MPTKTVCSRFFAFILVFMAAAMVSPELPAKETYLRQWPRGVAAPPLKLSGLDGREWDAKGLRGKVVVLNFWATWCGPCIDELAYLNELAGSEFTKGKPVILGVNFKESTSKVQAFAGEHKFDYPILMDKSGEHFNKWADGVLPTTVLIDRHGRPRWRIVGELNRTDTSLKKAIETLLQEH